MRHLLQSLRHSASAGVTLIALLASAGPAGAQDQITPIRGQQDLADRAAALKKPPGYEGREEGELISVNFATGAFVGPAGGGLPFDVAFKLTGPLTEGYEELSARFIEFNRVPDCQGFFSPAQILVARNDAIPVRPRRPARAIESSGFRGAVFAADKKSFVVEFPPLRPNHYYCFEFVSKKKVGEDVLAGLRAKFTEAIDAEFRKEEYVSTLGERQQTRRVFGAKSLEDYQRLRATLIRLLEEELAQGQTLLAPQGSFFDVNTPFDSITQEYREDFERIPEKSVGQRLDSIKAYRDGIRDALGALDKLSSRSFPLTGGGETTVADLLAGNSSEVSGIRAATGVDLEGVFANLRSGDALSALEDPGVDVFWTPETQESHPLDDKTVELRELGLAIQRLKELARDAGVVVDGSEPPPPSRPATRSGGRANNDEQVIDLSAARRQTVTVDTFSSLADEAEAALGFNNDASSGATAALFDLRTVIDERARYIAALTSQLFVELRQIVRIGGTTVADYETRAIWYMSADVGSGISWDTEDLFTYLGWNMYFRPVNKKAHLSWGGRPYGIGEELMRRFSITLGLVQSGFEEENGRFKGVVGNARRSSAPVSGSTTACA